MMTPSSTSLAVGHPVKNQQNLWGSLDYTNQSKVGGYEEYIMS
jgi:hypothetical protein